jgi:hypothetical protein
MASRAGVRNGAPQIAFDRLVMLETDECVIWPHSRGTTGYGKMRAGDGGRHQSVPALALECRVGPRPPGMEAAHGPCHDRACMNYRHLSWKTRRENHADKRRDGTVQRGEQGTLAKLTDTQVVELRRLHADGWTFTALGQRYGVHRRTVARAVRGASWGHL